MQKIPTVANMLVSISGSMQDTSEILQTYANLGFHYDGKDRSGASVRSIRKFMRDLDKLADDTLGTDAIEVVEIEGEDDLEIHYQDLVYRFRAPTLRDRIKAKPEDLGIWLREMIDRFGDPGLLDLPYPAIVPITRAASIVAGFL
jgi:hypothetical protein